MKRATGRFTCPKCGNIYNIYFDTFKDENKCNNCGEMLQHREDDTESKFEHRFNTYLEKTVKKRLSIFYLFPNNLITYTTKSPIRT